MYVQVQASNITSNELLKQDMAAVQAELTQLRQEAKTTGASTKEMQAQHQVAFMQHNLAHLHPDA